MWVGGTPSGVWRENGATVVKSSVESKGGVKCLTFWAPNRAPLLSPVIEIYFGAGPRPGAGTGGWIHITNSSKTRPI